MKQVIEWKQLPKNLDKLEKDLYLFKTKKPFDYYPPIICGRLWYEVIHMPFYYHVFVTLKDVDIRIPINYFSHYTEVKRSKC